MADQHKLYQDLEAGHQANLVLEQVGERFETIAQNLHDTWEHTKSDDEHGREMCWRQLKALREVQRSFTNDQRGAVLAQKELEKKHAS